MIHLNNAEVEQALTPQDAISYSGPMVQAEPLEGTIVVAAATLPVKVTRLPCSVFSIVTVARSSGMKIRVRRYQSGRLGKDSGVSARA